MDSKLCEKIRNIADPDVVGLLALTYIGFTNTKFIKDTTLDKMNTFTTYDPYQNKPICNGVILKNYTTKESIQMLYIDYLKKLKTNPRTTLVYSFAQHVFDVNTGQTQLNIRGTII